MRNCSDARIFIFRPDIGGPIFRDDAFVPSPTPPPILTPDTPAPLSELRGVEKLLVMVCCAFLRGVNKPCAEEEEEEEEENVSATCC
jgi:hypothetical protein